MISALILAAGQSRRMGQPKMLLPWGTMTVIEKVLTTFLEAGIEDILVVTGGAREQVESILTRYPVRSAYNQEYDAGEMLSSLQAGLLHMPGEAQSALIGLGDQPQVEENTIRRICDAYREQGSLLVVPSVQKRRGHPWLVRRQLWGEILALKPHESPRDFLNRHAREIQYVDVGTPTILADLDTPEDYQESHPGVF